MSAATDLSSRLGGLVMRGAKSICSTGLGGLFVAVLFLGTAPAACGAPASSHRTDLVNKKAPEISRNDLDGRKLDLRSYRGKVVLLNFWATWCAPCLTEMPVFAKWQQQYGSQGLQIVGISMDDDSAPVQKVLLKLKVNYPVAMGDAVLGERYGGVLGLPLTYLIDRDGVVRARFQGETKLSTIERQVKLMVDLR